MPPRGPARTEPEEQEADERAAVRRWAAALLERLAAPRGALHWRSQRATEVFGDDAEAALDALALLDFAWHDCYGEPSPSDAVMHDIWDVGGGNLAQFIVAAHLAVIHLRDLRVWADRHRKGT